MPGVIDYFNNTMARVFVSVGGATYKDSWETALQTNPKLLADKCCAIAERYNVGIEIDYEESANPLLRELEAFIVQYRDATNCPFEPGPTPSAKSLLTIDFGQGAQFMAKTANWVAHNAFDTNQTKRLLNWANAMVGGGRQSRVSEVNGMLSSSSDRILSIFLYDTTLSDIMIVSSLLR